MLVVPNVIRPMSPYRFPVFPMLLWQISVWWVAAVTLPLSGELPPRVHLPLIMTRRLDGDIASVLRSPPRMVRFS